MTPRFVRLCLALLSVSVAQLQAQPAPAPLPTNPPGTPAAPNPNDPLVTLKLPDADIDTVLSTLEIFTGRTVLHPAGLPTTNYNLKMADAIPKSQAILAIETVLALNNVGISPLGERFLVATVLPQTRSTAPQWISGSAFDFPASGKVAMKVFQLDFLRVVEVQQMIQGLLNPNLASPIVPIQNANAMLVTDSVANLQRIESLLQQVDKPITAGMRPKFYGPLTNASAAGVVNKIRSILQGTLTQQLGTATTYQADERTNQIILVTDPRQYPFFDELIAKLDVNATASTRNDVIYLNHANAAKLVTVLTTVIQGQNAAVQKQNQGSVRQGQIGGPQQGPMGPNVPGAPIGPGAVVPPAAANAALAAAEGAGAGSAEFSPYLTIAADERSNSVVVSGTGDDLRIITELIKKLDTILAQARIEVVIAEVTLDDSHTSGISQLGLKVDGDKLVGFSGSGYNVSISGDGTSGTFASIVRAGAAAAVSGPWDLAGLISIGTSPRKTNSTILTVPAIVTSHGKKGVLNDGDKRPLITGTTNNPTSGTNGFATSSQVQFTPIGTTLTVTPYIGSDGSVQLEIQTVLSDVTGNVTIDGNNQPIIGERSTDSYVTAKSGEIIVMGGFRKRINSKNTTRLGPIPIIGDLLGTRNKSNYHQELIFFLRPYVLTNKPDIDNVEPMKTVEKLPTREQIKEQLDPNYVPPKQSIIDKILPK